MRAISLLGKQLFHLLLGIVLIGTGSTIVAQPTIMIWRHGAQVNATSLNIRNMPGLSGLVLATVRENTSLFYSNLEEGEWIRVRTEEGDEGWTIKHFLKIPERTAAPLPRSEPDPREELAQSMAEEKRYAVTRPGVTLAYYGPGEEHPVRGELAEGTHVVLGERRGSGWTQVREPNRKESVWIRTESLFLYDPRRLPKVLQDVELKQHTSMLEAGVQDYMEEAYQRGAISREDQLFMVVQDLHSGELLVSIRPRRHVKAASMIKVPILQAYMMKLYRGQIEHSASNEKHLENMIRLSSNYSTNAVLKRLGGPNAVQTLLDEARMYRELRLVEYIPQGGRTYRNQVSAGDLNQLFVRIWSGRGLGPGFSELENRAASRKMLDYLGMGSDHRVNDRLKDGTCYAENDQVKLWDKTGFVKGVNGNAGIVEIDTPHGRRAYSVVLILERANYQSIDGNAVEWSSSISEQMRRISEMVYAHFNLEYEAADDCGYESLIHHVRRAHEQEGRLRAAL